jgi:hypothetical protein
MKQTYLDAEFLPFGFARQVAQPDPEEIAVVITCKMDGGEFSAATKGISRLPLRLFKRREDRTNPQDYSDRNDHGN